VKDVFYEIKKTVF